MYVLILMITPAAGTHTHDRSVVRVFKVITFFTSTDRTDYDSNARAAREKFFGKSVANAKDKAVHHHLGCHVPFPRRLSFAPSPIISPIISLSWHLAHRATVPKRARAGRASVPTSLVWNRDAQLREFGLGPCPDGTFSCNSWWFQVRKPHLLVWHF
jgi:hypothetical protein